MSVTRLALLHATRNIHGCRLLVPALGLLLAAALPVAARDPLRGEYSKTIPVSPPVIIVVRHIVGDFQIRAGAVNEVRIHAAIKVETEGECAGQDPQARVKEFTESPAVHVNGSSVRIGEWDEMANHQCSKETYTLEVPATSALQVETKVGRVVALDIAGPIRIEAGVGQVELTNPGQSVAVQTLLGSIQVSGVPRGDWRLDARTGGAELLIPKEAGFRLDAMARSLDDGAIESDFSQHLRLRGASLGERVRVQEEFNGGGPLLRVRVGLGKIRIKEL